VLLVNVDGDVRAYRNQCPHQAWALSEGDFDGETITCARHMWEFDARSGKGGQPGELPAHHVPVSGRRRRRHPGGPGMNRRAPCAGGWRGVAAAATAAHLRKLGYEGADRPRL